MSEYATIIGSNAVGFTVLVGGKKHAEYLGLESAKNHADVLNAAYAAGMRDAATWHPVSEPPDIGTDVIVFNSLNPGAGTWPERWFSGCESICTHWHELPAPPEASHA